MNGRLAACVIAMVLCPIATRDGSASTPIKLNGALAQLGDVQSGFQITPDGHWVLYRADQDADGVFELYCVAMDGGTPVKLNGPLGAGGDVASWQANPADNQVVYWADQQQDNVTEVYSVSINGGLSLKLNPPLANVGSTGGAIVGDRVVYIACEQTNTFFEPYFELFSVPIAGGQAERLNDMLAPGGDVLSLLTRPDIDRVVYLADQYADEVVELYSVSSVTGPPIKLNAQLVTNGDVRAEGLQFSPDGQHVLYAADQDTDDVVEIYRVPTSGGTPVKLNGSLVLGGNVTAGSQRFSPDGTRVAYVADQNADEVFEAFSVESSGGTPARLNGSLVTGGDVVPSDLRFSPDGSRVLYRADQKMDEVVELFSVPSTGGAPVKLNGPLVDGGDVLDNPVFSPNGEDVLYRANQDQQDIVGLYLVSATSSEGGSLAAPSIPGGAVVSAAFSADGNYVVYLADQYADEVFELFAVPVTGGMPMRLNDELTAGGDVVEWQFSPDGQSVVYRADQETDEQFELYSVRFTNDVPGDFNHDGIVNAADYTVWRDGLGSTYSVDDYGVWKANFGAGAGSGSAIAATSESAVPEPEARLLASCVFLALGGVARRR